jgi:hypothetical protein
MNTKDLIEVKFSRKVSEENKQKLFLFLKENDFTLTRDLKTMEDLELLFKYTTPLITEENYLLLKGKKLNITMTEQVRYNGADYNFKIDNKPIWKHFTDNDWKDFFQEEYNSWDENFSSYCYGDLLESIPGSFHIYGLIGSNPSEEIIEFFKNKECILEFVDDQEELFTDFNFENKKEYMDKTIGIDIFEGMDS